MATKKTPPVDTKAKAAAAKAKKEVQSAVPRNAAGDVDITSWLGTDVAKQIETAFKGVPSGKYTPTLINPNAVLGLYNQNPLTTTEGLQKQLAAQRADALQSQIAALDTRYKDSLGQLDSAYGAVNQLLGTAQQDFTKGYNPILASQAGLNADTAASAQQVQADMAARLASTGTSSVGGAQAGAVGSQVAAETAAAGASQSGMLTGMGSAMQNYMTGMAPQLASLARAGAVQGLGSARINAEAQARAQAAQSQLEDMRALALQDIQAKNQRAGDIIGAVGNVMGQNVQITNSANAANAQAAASLAMAKANLKAQLQMKQAVLIPQAKIAVDSIDNNVSKFVAASGGRGAAAVFNEAPDGTPLDDKTRLMNPDGSLNYNNYDAWQKATNRDESYLMTYLAAAKARGAATSSDYDAALQTLARVQADSYLGDAAIDYTKNKAAAAQRDKLYGENLKRLTTQWGSYGVFPEDAGVTAGLTQYLRDGMASAFRSYIPSGMTAPVQKQATPLGARMLDPYVLNAKPSDPATGWFSGLYLG